MRTVFFMFLNTKRKFVLWGTPFHFFLFSCEVCEKSLSRNGNLGRHHMKTGHSHVKYVNNHFTLRRRTRQ